MAHGKRPFQMGPRTPEQKQRMNGIRFPQQDNQPDLPPEIVMRRRALSRLEVLPPYQSVMPYEMTFQTVTGETETRQFKGLTKREHIVTAIAAAAVAKDGLPLLDAECESIARRALIMSEHILQTLSKARGTDMEGQTAQIIKEDEAAAAESAAQRVGE